MESLQNEEESFVVLGSTSPHPSLVPVPQNHLYSSLEEDVQKLVEIMEGSSNTKNGDSPSIISDSCLAFKAHFNIEQPSPHSMATAGNLLSDCMNTSDMQVKVGELLDENVLLRDTLKQNNISMKMQFKTIAEWQEDMMKTHQVHKVKFSETKALIEKLRLDNTQLKKDLDLLKEASKSAARCDDKDRDKTERSLPDSNESESLVANTFEYISNDDKKTIDMLSSQLEIIEKQRRQVIAENETLIWQKESLEKAMDVSQKEITALKSKIATLENSLERAEELSNEELKHKVKQAEESLLRAEDIWNIEIIELKEKLYQAEQKIKSISDVKHIKALQGKISNLQIELKNAQLKLFEAENTKLEYLHFKQISQETTNQLKESLEDMKMKLKDIHTIAFQPVRCSISMESQSENVEFANFLENIKMYDRNMVDLAKYLNLHAEGFSKLFDSMTDLVNYSMLQSSQSPAANSKLGIMKQCLSDHHRGIATHNFQVKSTLSILEKIFLDYQQVLKILGHKEKETGNISNTTHDELTCKILSQEERLKIQENEVLELRKIVETFQKDSDERDLLRAQLEIYKGDFELERDSRTQLAAENAELASNLRSVQKTLLQFTDEGNIFVNGPGTSKTPGIAPLHVKAKQPLNRTSKTPASASNEVEMYQCPNCFFKTLDYGLIDRHMYSCLDNLMP